MAGKAGDDDPLSGVRIEHAAERGSYGGLRGGEAWLLGIGGIREQQPDAGIRGQSPNPTQVGESPVYGSEVELEIPRVEDDPLGSVERGGETVRHRMGDGYELDIERPDLAALAVRHFDEGGPIHESSLFDSVSSQAQGQSRAIDGD